MQRHEHQFLEENEDVKVSGDDFRMKSGSLKFNDDDFRRKLTS